MLTTAIARRIFLFLLIACSLCLASAVQAADEVDNPKYAAWAKFKPGSSETFESDIQSQGKRYHIKTTQKLISVSDDEVVVEMTSVSSVKGQKDNPSTKRETIKAKVKDLELKATGEKEVEAMGKTFKCKVFEGSGKPAAPTGANSKSESIKGTIFVSGDVPGGLVRLEAVDPDGNRHTFILTAMETK